MSVDPSSRGWNEHQHRLPWPLAIVAGKLGLNQPAPAEILDVVGNIKASGTIVAGGTIQAAAAGSLLPIPAGAALSYGTGWQDYASPFGPVVYWIDAFGVVHLQGLATTNSATAATVIATLPTGYRPPVAAVFVQASSNPGNGALRIDINNAGQIVVAATIAGTAWTPSATADSTWVSLSGIAFRTT